MSEFMQKSQRRCVVVNLDPANDFLPYDCAVDIKDLIRLDDVMNVPDPESGILGPNGGLLYCLEYLEKNINWLREALRPYENHWILFDCPGQIELYTVHPSMKKIFTLMTEEWKWRTTCIHLIDVAHCLDSARFVSALFLSLTAMVYLEQPHINVLSKIDQISQFGRLRKKLLSGSEKSHDLCSIGTAVLYGCAGFITFNHTLGIGSVHGSIRQAKCCDL
jgi:GPN-loop GTPase